MTAPHSREVARLHHVLEAIERAERYTAYGPASLDDDRTYDAVLRCLTVVGEALGAVSRDTAAQLPSSPPARAKDQRNLIVHEYWRVDPAVVWATVTTSLPQLRAEITALLEQ